MGLLHLIVQHGLDQLAEISVSAESLYRVQLFDLLLQGHSAAAFTSGVSLSPTGPDWAAG